MSKLKIDWNKISEQIKESETKTSFKKKEEDKRFYTPDVSKDGYAEVRIRLLPSPDTDIPYIKKYNHGFVTNGQWLIENCPTTIGEKCPICEDTSSLWNGAQADRDLAATRSRKLSIITNILVIKDLNHPENEGKVFLWRYGKKLHEKIMDKINPKSGSIDDPVMVYDPQNGADFKLKAKKTSYKKRNGETANTMNYDTSEFASPSALTSEQIKIVEENLYPLSEFIDKKDFKSYDVLSNLLARKTGVKSTPRAEVDSDSDNRFDVKESAGTQSTLPPSFADDEDEAGFFKNIRNNA